MTNIVTANLAKSRFFRCPPLYQYNYGMVLKITGIDLPTAYEVDFANDVNGTSITQIGNANGVTIPAQYFVPGQAIYCWLRVHPTQDSGVTTATIVIPISPRATITDDEPTPEEQSAIDEAIAALNTAVEHVDDAVEHYPTITGGIWYVWDVDAGEYVSTGISATGPQGERGETGSQGPRGETGSQGPRGETGATGAAGADGFSPTATVTQTASGATISITDKQGTTTANISNGQDGSPGQPGTDGVSPTVTVTDITGGHRITITDATGAHSFDVMDGHDGQGAVQDVQVNGVSVLSDGVANVPVANASRYGVVRTDADYGTTYLNDRIAVQRSADDQCKSGAQQYRPIVPYNQHLATFYGLAKAAGDSSQSSSSNAVGQYTDAAKSAIRAMFGIKDWQSIMLTESDYDTTAEAFVFDAGSGNEIAEARVYGQIVWDDAISDIKLAVGFGANSGWDQYNKFSIKTGIESSKRIAITAEGKNILFASGSNNVIRMQYGYSYFGTLNTNAHSISVDLPCNKSMNNKGACPYWNYNDPRYFSVYAPSGAAWANIYIEYVLR